MNVGTDLIRMQQQYDHLRRSQLFAERALGISALTRDLVQSELHIRQHLFPTNLTRDLERMAEQIRQGLGGTNLTRDLVRMGEQLRHSFQPVADRLVGLRQVMQRALEVEQLRGIEEVLRHNREMIDALALPEWISHREPTEPQLNPRTGPERRRVGFRLPYDTR